MKQTDQCFRREENNADKAEFSYQHCERNTKYPKSGNANTQNIQTTQRDDVYPSLDTMSNTSLMSIIITYGVHLYLQQQ